MFRCNLPPALLAEWPGSFTCHCSNTGVERTPNKSQHRKLTLEKKILLPFLPGFDRAIFRSRVRRSYPQAIPASLDAATYKMTETTYTLFKMKSAIFRPCAQSFTHSGHATFVPVYPGTMVSTSFWSPQLWSLLCSNEVRAFSALLAASSLGNI